MLRLRFLMIFALFTAAFSETRAQQFGSATEKPVVYKSFGNHIGEVALVLAPDHKFICYFESYKDGKDRKLKGKWSKRGDTIRLVFKGKPVFKEVFMRQVKSMKIESERVVKFSEDERGLYIWGVFCLKDNV